MMGSHPCRFAGRGTRDGLAFRVGFITRPKRGVPGRRPHALVPGRRVNFTEKKTDPP